VQTVTAAGRLAGVLLLLTAVTFACGGRGKEGAGKTASVVKRDFAATVLATGSITAKVGAEVRVGARVSGKVQRLRSNIGDQVKKGDVIAELDKADLEANVVQRVAELEISRSRLASLEKLQPMQIEKARADVAKWEATVSLAEKDLQRKSDLLKDELASQQDVDDAREQLEVAKAELAFSRESLRLIETQYPEDLSQAAKDVERAKGALDNARATLSYTTITAPIDGVVGSVSTQEGETVAAGFNAPTFVTIIDLTRLEVDAYVDEVDIGKVKTGQKGSFSVDAFPGREFEGVVSAIYPKAVIQENVVYYIVVLDIIGDYEGLLRPQMTASVTLTLEDRPGVLAVPARAVQRDRGRNVAWVVGEDSKPERREIAVGWRDGQWLEVVSGLSEGEKVLIEAPASAAPAGGGNRD